MQEPTPRDTTRPPVQLPVVESRAERDERVQFETKPNVGTVRITGKDLTSAPRLFGEADVLRAIRALPGVNARNDYSVGMNVRGGEADQNLVLLDGHPVYNPFHLGGLFGAFVEPMVGYVEFFTGAFPARFGGRLSSVVDVRSRREERDGVHGSLGVSLIATTLGLGGGIEQGRGSWTLAARRTYADRFAAALGEQLPYHFSDVQGFAEYGLPGDIRLGITAYANRDLLDARSIHEDNKVLVGWGNRLLGASAARTWLAPGGTGLFGADSVTLEQRFSRSVFGLDIDFFDGYVNVTNQVADHSASGTLGFHSARRSRTFGYDVGIQRYQYLSNFDLVIYPNDTISMSNRSVGVWFDEVWKPNDRWLVEWGARVDAVSGTGGALVQPRFSAKRFLSPDLAITAGYGEFAQWAHTLAREDIPLRALDFWVGSDSRAAVSRARHWLLGVERWLTSARALRVEGWLKQYPDLVERNPFSDPTVAGDEFVPARGHSYGGDLLLRQLGPGKYSGWLAYTYAMNSRTDHQSRRFFPAQDRRHDLTIVASRTGRRYTQSLRFNLASGTPYTPILGEFPRLEYDPVQRRFDRAGVSQFLVGPRNGERLPLSQRLDVSVTRRGGPGGVTFSPFLSIMNLYSAKNVVAYVYNVTAHPPERIGLPQIPVFPTVGVTIAW